MISLQTYRYTYINLITHIPKELNQRIGVQEGHSDPAISALQNLFTRTTPTVVIKNPRSGLELISACEEKFPDALGELEHGDFIYHHVWKAIGLEGAVPWNNEIVLEMFNPLFKWYGESFAEKVTWDIEFPRSPNNNELLTYFLDSLLRNSFPY